MNAFRAPFLLLALANSAFGQLGEETPAECRAPCVDVTSLLALNAMEPNATLFADADVVCGSPVSDLLQSALPTCLADADVLAGCDCRSGASCEQEVQAAFTDECRAAIIQTGCDNAFWFDEQTGVNVRNLYTHILNDCNPGVEAITCDASVPPFDPAFCGEGGAPASAAAAPAGTITSTAVAPGTITSTADAPDAQTGAASEDQGTQPTETPGAAHALLSSAAAVAAAVVPLIAAAL